MADAKISALTALTGADTASTDLFPLVDVSDTTMAASGTTKKTTRADLQTYVGGTVTADTPTLNLTQTWNSGAVTFTGIKQNITDTASATASLLIDLQVGGTSQFVVTKGGVIGFGSIANPRSYMAAGPFNGDVKFTSSSAGTNPAFYIDANTTRVVSRAGGGYAFTSSTTDASAATVDTALTRVAAGIVGVGTGAAGSTAGTVQATNYKFPSNSNIAESSSTIYLQPAASGITQGVQAQSTVTVGSGNDTNAILNFNGGTALSKVSAGVIGVGTGASGSTAGTLKANNVNPVVLNDFSTGNSAMSVFAVASTGASPTMYFTSAGRFSFRSDGVAGWTSSASDASGTVDAALSRVAAGIIGVGTGAAGSTAGTLQALKYTGIGGTVTADAPVLDITQTWNNGAVTFTGIKSNITNTASAAASLLMDLQIGGTSRFKIGKDGNIVQTGGGAISGNSFDPANNSGYRTEINVIGGGSALTVYSNNTAAFQLGYQGMGIASGLTLGWNSGAATTSSQDTGLSRISAAVVGVGNGTAADVSGTVQAAVVRTGPGTAIPAGGANTFGFTATSTANFGVFFGSGAPTLSAAKGSLYLRSDGSTTNDRMYVNTNGSTTWTAVTTVA